MYGELSKFNLEACPQEFDLVECINCSLIYLSYLPKEEIFEQLYKSNRQFDGEAYHGERARKATEFYSDRLRAILDRRLFETKDLKVLEIGAGMSWMSRVAKQAYPSCTTTAQDISSECEDSCDWVDEYVVGDIDEKHDLLTKRGPYDIISLTHAIEHFPFPLRTMRLLVALLESRGTLFITAPHRPKDWMKSQRIEDWRKWSYNHVPAHLQYFSRKSLEVLASNLDLEILFFDSSHEEGQALEVWFRRRLQNSGSLATY
jgi:2-polyprenyl-3-methyl-5-hydroxy-6-metoxy-1,4-benzoquinol methylase